MNFNKIKDAITDIKEGKVVIVVDDENRENEGDFVAAAEMATSDMINFMATHGRGLICTPIIESRCEELGLDLMVGKNTAAYETPFTISVDLIGHGCSTGISTNDRAKTVQALVNPNTNAEEFGKPGHIFPLKALEGGVLRRAGHTEAAIDLARMAGLHPGGVIVEILNEDGSMARVPELKVIAKKFDLKIITIKDMIEYRIQNESLIKEEACVNLPTEYGSFKMKAYRQLTNNRLHLLLYKGEWKVDEAILVRVHSSCMTGDIFGSCRCDCGHQLQSAMQQVEKVGKGIIVYMNQEGRGIGLINKMKAYELQEEGKDTVEANLALGFNADDRDYGIGAQMLRDMKVSKIKLLSNNPTKKAGLIGYGLEIIENIPLEIESNEHNDFYLKTKRDKMGHSFKKLND